MGACAREDMEPYSSWEFVSEEDMEVQVWEEEQENMQERFLRLCLQHQYLLPAAVQTK